VLAGRLGLLILIFVLIVISGSWELRKIKRKIKITIKKLASCRQNQSHSLGGVPCFGDGFGSAGSISLKAMGLP